MKMKNCVGYSTPTGFTICANGIRVESKEVHKVNIPNKSREEQENEADEWHAVEHKLIWILSNEKELTLENLRNAPITTAGCVSSFGTTKFLREPSEEKLLEGLRVGLEYLRLMKNREKNSSFLFSSP